MTDAAPSSSPEAIAVASSRWKPNTVGATALTVKNCPARFFAAGSKDLTNIG